jgi:hypothetical protein
MAAPLLACAVSFSGNTAYRYLTVDRELARTRNTLEAYVSPQLVRYVMDNLDSIRFDGQKAELQVVTVGENGITEKDILPVRFVPMTGKVRQ